MVLPKSNRAQASLVGAILLFGFLVLSLTIYQANVVPNQNAEIEYNHYNDVRSDMTSLYSEITTLSRSSDNGQMLVPINTGVRYPSRILAINPPPVAGSVQSSSIGTIHINGSSTVSDDICGSPNTSGIRYETAYHELNQPSVVYESGILYAETDDDDHVVLNNRTLIDNSSKTINIFRIAGTFRSQSSVSSIPVELTGTKTYGQTDIQVENITIPSDLSTSKWNSTILPAGITATPNGSSVDLSGFQGNNYTVQCFSVGVGQEPETDFIHNATFN